MRGTNVQARIVLSLSLLYHFPFTPLSLPFHFSLFTLHSFILLADVAGVDVGFVVLDTLAVLGAVVVVERGAGVALGYVLVFHIGSVGSVVDVALAGLGVARGKG